MKTKKRLFFHLFLLSLFFSLFLQSLHLKPVLASSIDRRGDSQLYSFSKESGMDGKANIGSIVSGLITTVLGLLGIIFVVLMVYAGFLWMTAQGNEDQVKKSKGIITTAIIGLLIVIAAYSITAFVFNALGNTTGSGGGMI